jgi:tetratricopeptide (TPR) repeat protein
MSAGVTNGRMSARLRPSWRHISSLKLWPVLALILFLTLPALLAAQTPASRDSKGSYASSDGFRYSPPGPAKSVEVGNFYLKRKDYKGALSRFEEAVQTDPNYAPAYLGLGKVYEKTGATQKALDAYQKYLDLLPSDKDAEDAKEVHRAIDRLRKSVASAG